MNHLKYFKIFESENFLRISKEELSKLPDFIRLDKLIKDATRNGGNWYGPGVRIILSPVHDKKGNIQISTGLSYKFTIKPRTGKLDYGSLDIAYFPGLPFTKFESIDDWRSCIRYIGALTAAKMIGYEKKTGVKLIQGDSSALSKSLISLIESAKKDTFFLANYEDYVHSFMWIEYLIEIAKEEGNSIMLSKKAKDDFNEFFFSNIDILNEYILDLPLLFSAAGSVTIDQYFKDHPWQIYKLDNHPDLKNDIIKRTGIDDMSNVGRLFDL
jgi:hypothetical protein